MAKRLSKAGARSETGQLLCPRCGGASFGAKRSVKGKILGGFLLAPKSRVKCQTCGEVYKRG